MDNLNTPKLGSSLGLGIGLRHCHADDILAGKAQVDWFEAISENYIDSGGRSIHILKQVAERYPVVFHGVSMSIGSTDPLDFNYLKKLKALTKDIPPQWVSDHLCWTGIMGINSHDLLPVPLTEATLRHTAQRVDIVQDFLGRQLILENPSTYMQFTRSTLSEPDFLRSLTEETGCGLLLDVNNVFVTAFNSGTDPCDYLADFPFEKVVQMHLAGHEHCGSHIIDTHDQPVSSEVWELFRTCWKQTNGAATCLEWDGNIPSLAECQAELFKARNYIGAMSEDVTFEPDVISTPSSSGISTPVNFILPQVMESVEGDCS